MNVVKFRCTSYTHANLLYFFIITCSLDGISVCLPVTDTLLAFSSVLKCYSKNENKIL